MSSAFTPDDVWRLRCEADRCDMEISDRRRRLGSEPNDDFTLASREGAAWARSLADRIENLLRRKCSA